MKMNSQNAHTNPDQEQSLLRCESRNKSTALCRPTRFETFSLPQKILSRLTPLGQNKRYCHPCQRRLPMHERRSILRSALAEKKSRVIRAKLALRLSKISHAQHSRRRHERAAIRRQAHLSLLRARATSIRRRISSQRQLGDENDMQQFGDEFNEAILPRFTSSLCTIEECYRNVVQLGILKKLRTSSFDSLNVLTRTESEISVVVSILRDIGVHRIRPFFYSYLLVAEFRECILTGTRHPGYNSNVENDEIMNFTNNFVWLLLYKLCLEMIAAFETVLGDFSQKNLDVFSSIVKLFYFVFDLFKHHHYMRLLKLVGSGIKVAQMQLNIFEGNLDLKKQLQNLLEHKRYLDSTLPVKLTAEMVEWFENLLCQVSERLLLISSRMAIKVVVCDPQLLRYNHLYFPIPLTSQISLLRWRLYWFSKFQSEASQSFPSRMRSGNIRLSDQQLFTCNVDSILGQCAFFDRYASLREGNSFDSLSVILTDIQNDFVLYLRVCCDSSKDISLVQVDSLKFASNETLILVLARYFDTMYKLASLNSIHSVSECSQKCLQCLPNSPEDGHSNFLALVQLLEISVQNTWLARCEFKSFSEYVSFESTLVYTGCPNYSLLQFNLLTHSPCLLFPKVYAQLSKYTTRPVGTVRLEDYHHILCASYSTPNLYSLSPVDSILTFFRSLYGRMVIEGNYQRDFEEDEINSIFRRQLRHLCKQFSHIIKISVCLVMWRAWKRNNLLIDADFMASGSKVEFNDVTQYKENHGRNDISSGDDARTKFFKTNSPFDGFSGQSHLGNNTTDKILAHELYEDGVSKVFAKHFGKASEFCEYYLRCQGQITKLVSQKIAAMFCDGSWVKRGKQVCGYHTQLTDLCEELDLILRHIYAIYHPLYNWIHQDLR